MFVLSTNPQMAVGETAFKVGAWTLLVSMESHPESWLRQRDSCGEEVLAPRLYLLFVGIVAEDVIESLERLDERWALWRSIRRVGTAHGVLRRRGTKAQSVIHAQ